ncbi:hypothetical protein AXG93_2782s1140 [Marchantia polymorpha subsp. ruderalis]|uniref:Uncharacterized protein n=1 Tax=Marchantia polymorpha subsp. ruderalis TaxID=1480154 RepID=A0A176WQY7_MARPO|nr:hypothetical protein AXG93_2782s1140 [Marchantia polymorpha subsp. ruderalis]
MVKVANATFKDGTCLSLLPGSPSSVPATTLVRLPTSSGGYARHIVTQLGYPTLSLFLDWLCYPQLVVTPGLITRLGALEDLEGLGFWLPAPQVKTEEGSEKKPQDIGVGHKLAVVDLAFRFAALEPTTL